MKKIFAYSLLLILTFSCSEGDFSDTEMYFETDKETYKANDNFEITVVVSPKNGEKKIRVFKNFINLKISFQTKDEGLGFSRVVRNQFIELPSSARNDSEYIDEYTISSSQPFKRTFKGTISETEQKIIFRILELNLTDSLEKSEVLRNSIITINGSYQTVYSGIEENFISKNINILIE